MTKVWAVALGVVVLLGGASVASASCLGDAAASRTECLSNGPRDRARTADCASDYRDDVAECHRYGGEPRPMPVRRPVPHHVIHHEPPPPPPHR